jgi:hypothetical protein
MLNASAAGVVLAACLMLVHVHWPAAPQMSVQRLGFGVTLILPRLAS